MNILLKRHCPFLFFQKSVIDVQHLLVWVQEAFVDEFERISKFVHSVYDALIKLSSEPLQPALSRRGRANNLLPLLGLHLDQRAQFHCILRFSPIQIRSCSHPLLICHHWIVHKWTKCSRDLFLAPILVKGIPHLLSPGRILKSLCSPRVRDLPDKPWFDWALSIGTLIEVTRGTVSRVLIKLRNGVLGRGSNFFLWVFVVVKSLVCFLIHQSSLWRDNGSLRCRDWYGCFLVPILRGCLVDQSRVGLTQPGVG